jgi:hypothetical protein
VLEGTVLLFNLNIFYSSVQYSIFSQLYSFVTMHMQYDYGEMFVYKKNKYFLSTQHRAYNQFAAFSIVLLTANQWLVG